MELRRTRLHVIISTVLTQKNNNIMADANRREYTVIVERDQKFKDHTASGWYVRETWMQGDRISRAIGPAVTIRHPVTHIAVLEEYRDEQGRLHNLLGPAVTYRNAHSGEIESEKYFEYGVERGPPELDPEPTGL